ncbi:MAG: FAD binding domain-containing protein [Rhodobacteraceae bacterium HLUCCA24]|nr:MAG: FAD binding domain-containing protein [Rhodobacteraceae bacterium HLUCCA24]
MPWPHFGDRAKPGVIAVAGDGRRFVNEGCPYHDFVPAMRRAARGGPAEAWLIADATALRRYGLGAVGPWPLPPGRWLRSGYLTRARTIRDLAHAVGLDPDALADTVARFNRHAAQGEDPDFGKGADPYSRGNGDPALVPNPCLRALADPPFYAIRMLPGDIGGLAGLETDAQARVLDLQGRPVPGLYAAGNAAASMCGGAYAGPGLTIGPAIVFGRIAALHASRADMSDMAQAEA